MKYLSACEAEAARHALTLQDVNADPQDIQDALDWINRSESNALAFQPAHRFLMLCEALSPPERSMLMSSLISVDKLFSRPLLALAASIAVLFTAVTAMFVLRATSSDLKPDSVQPRYYASKVGELRTISLSDGSIIELSSASSVQVSLEPRQRKVELRSGEALFKVAHDAHRPFRVETGKGWVTALGTAFNIHRQGEGATVTVVIGRVRVQAASPYIKSEAQLGASMQVSYLSDGAMTAARRVDPSTVLAWQRGELIFSGQPLAQVVQDLNRYSNKPVLLQDSQLGTIPVTGVIQVGRLQNWLRALGAGIGVSVVETKDAIVLRPASNGVLSGN